MRKKGIVYLLVIALIVSVIAYFARDRLFERWLEKGLQMVAGARVEVDNFHFSLFKMECSWDRLQIANKNDPWKNIIETGRASFDLETRPLFWKRINIREMVLEDVRSGTQRETDGSLPRKKEPPKTSAEPGMVQKAKMALEKQFGEIPIFDLSGLGKKLKIDSLIDINSLASVQAYDRLKLTADSSFNYWKSQLDVTVYTRRVNDLETKIKSLQLEKIDNIKDLAAATRLVKQLNDLRKETNALKKDVEGKHSALTQTFTNLQNQLQAAQADLQKDIKRAQELAKLKDLDVKDVSMLLFGDVIVSRVEKLLDYIALVRKYLPTIKKMTASGKVEKPPRFKGQDIRFPFHYRYPKFLIKTARLSAATAAGDTSRAYFLEGVLKGLTNEPPVYGKPTRFKLNLMKITGNKYNITGSFDHVAEQPRDSLWLKAENFGLGKIALKKKSKYFPRAVSAKKGDISLAGFFIGDQIDLNLNLDATPVRFEFAQQPGDKVAKVVYDVLTGLQRLNLKTKFSGQGADYKLTLNSNVDNVLANQVKLTLAKNLREAQQQVDNYVRTEVDKKRKDVEKIIEENRTKIYDQIDKAKQKVAVLTEEIEKRKKQLEQKKKELEDKAKNKLLNNIFKKPGH